MNAIEEHTERCRIKAIRAQAEAAGAAAVAQRLGSLNLASVESFCGGYNTAAALAQREARNLADNARWAYENYEYARKLSADVVDIVDRIMARKAAAA